ncbi:MAG: pyridoxal phosphate-dependent aminotransferase [Bdellovibrionaceae bacterium]|nr:pyridoxal phosphate-dependent aminotransferase [Pseudobdellovibrionaceae bacterium]
MILSQRARQWAGSGTMAMTAKAAQERAKGRNVISLTVGEPDWDTSDSAKKAACDAIWAGMTKYQPSLGQLELRQAITERTNQELNLKTYAAENVAVSAGAKFALYGVLQAICDPGDVVVVPRPAWGSYGAMIEMAQAHPRYVVTSAQSRFLITPEALRASLQGGVKAILLNSPNNPTGTFFLREEWMSLASVLREFPNVLIICDDVYNRLVFDASGLAPHLLHIAPDLRARTILINAASKSLAMTGWRVGWAIGEPELIQALGRLQSQSVTCLPGFTQVAVMEAMREDHGVLKKRMRDEMLPSCERMRNGLAAMPGLGVLAPQGALFLWVDISKYLGRTHQGALIASSMDFAMRLLEDQAVAVIPGSEFGQDDHVRITYSVPEPVAQDAVSRIQKFLSGFQG